MTSANPISRSDRLSRLLTAVQYISMARGLDAVMAIVRVATRRLVDADGATFVLRENGKCHYAEEDAISPLWKGQRFPMEECISGWVMLNRRPAVIEDIFADDRIPHDVYRQTFVRSLTIVPIRTIDPVGAIGVYWKDRHRSSEEEVALLQAVANAAAVAMDHVGAGTADPPKGLDAPPPREMVRMCSWTGKIYHEGHWVSVEEFLERRFGLAVTHGMSEEMYRVLTREIGA